MAYILYFQKGIFFRDIIQNSGMEKLPSYVYLIVGSIFGGIWIGDQLL